MSRSTPRKNRHRHHLSGGGPRNPAVSDYESDAAQYMEQCANVPLVGASAAAPAPISRDNDDLNWRVLKRYLPHMRSILAIAANVVVYKFVTDNEQNSWEKSGSEGTMFVVELEPLVIVDGSNKQHVIPQTCVYILNRKSMVNFQIDLGDATECEDLGELLVLRVGKEAGAEEGDENEAERKVIGLWIHPDKVNTRENNTSAILAAWKQVRDATREYLDTAVGGSVPGALSINGTHDGQPSPQAAQSSGRRLSITDLLGQRNGNG